MFKIFGDVHSKGILVPGPPCTKIGDFLGKPLLVSTFFDLSEIWDPLTAQGFLTLNNFVFYVEKRFEASFMAKIAKKGFFINFSPNVLQWPNSMRKLKKFYPYQLQWAGHWTRFWFKTVFGL